MSINHYPKSGGGPAGAPVAVLVVDDHEAVLASLQMVLQTKGYRVFTAPGGAEAVAIFKANPQTIQVVITDLMMPEMDGRDTIRALRELDPHVQFIAISGNALPEDVAGLYALGIVDFLAKPFGVKELMQAVDKALAMRQQSLAGATAWSDCC